MIRGSYYNGFAPRDGMPLYPSLWRGCIGAWAPCLGPTGVVLRDWSGFANHGTLTNMDPPTDWIPSGPMYSLDFDGTDDRVVGAKAMSITGNVSVSAWVKTNSASQIHTIVSNANTANTDSVWGLYVLGNFSNRPSFKVNGNWATIFSGPTISNGVWTHLVAVHKAGVGVDVYINGVPTNWSLAFTPSSTTQAVTIGNENPSGNRNQLNGSVDDIRVYDRLLTSNEVLTLASRRGIAYDLAQFRMPYSEQAGFQAAWALRQRLILGGGGGLG